MSSPPPLGPFVGATLFELFGDREFRDALKAGVGATLGLLFGAVGKVAVGMVMMLMFTWSVVARSMEANQTEPELPPPPAEHGDRDPLGQGEGELQAKAGMHDVVGEPAALNEDAVDRRGVVHVL